MLKRKVSKQNIVLVVLLLLFILFTGYLALNIKMGISSDSWYHLRVSQEYSTTLGIPSNTPDTYQWRDITNIPYLYFWINGRVLNLNDSTFGFNQVVLLRIINIIYSFITVIGVYLLSKEFFKNKWVQLIPVALLTNTLMFLMLSSSINYDNLGNMFATFAILFFVKTVKNRGILKYPLLVILMLCLGTLTKFTIMPLAFILVILLLYELFKYRKELLKNLKGKSLLLLLPVLLFGGLNVLLYGNNLIKYQELTPSCEKILTHEQCLSNGVYYRDIITMPAVEVNVVDMILNGERLDPVRYVGVWVWEMTKRVVSIMGDSSLYHSNTVISIFVALLCITVIFGVLNWKGLSKQVKYLGIITLFYLLILMLVQNYDMYLKRSYPTLALQGRYMFPVISSFYVLITVFWMSIKNRYLKIFLISISLVLLISLSIPFFLLEVDPSWFGTLTY
ncbi:MAG: glycosyltransferase family 39 protein [Candidatus Dojkabacteria bacterium]|nr:glycosyltransferase family 39 protein [Candidatus Dojkabacteria bacterium]